MQKGQCIIKRLAVGFTFSNLLAKQDKSSGKIKELGMNSVSENSIFFPMGKSCKQERKGYEKSNVFNQRFLYRPFILLSVFFANHLISVLSP